MPSVGGAIGAGIAGGIAETSAGAAVGMDICCGGCAIVVAAGVGKSGAGVELMPIMRDGLGPAIGVGAGGMPGTDDVAGGVAPIGVGSAAMAGAGAAGGVAGSAGGGVLAVIGAGIAIF